MTRDEYFMIYEKSIVKEILKNIFTFPFKRRKLWKKRNQLI